MKKKRCFECDERVETNDDDNNAIRKELLLLSKASQIKQARPNDANFGNTT